MLTEDQARRGAGGCQPLENQGFVQEHWTGFLVEVDDSIDRSGYPESGSPTITPACLDRSPRGGSSVFHEAPYDDDRVLDQWLASIAPDEFEHILDGLASLESGPLVALEPAR